MILFDLYCVYITLIMNIKNLPFYLYNTIYNGRYKKKIKKQTVDGVINNYLQ